MGPWLLRDALPLWATAGFDETRGTFFERLSFQGTPVVGIPRRLMVQARQLFSYSMAARRGWMPGAERLVVTGARSMLRDYFEAGGRAGWALSVDDDGRVIDSRRDLYAHAFVLLGLASAYQVDPDHRYLDCADSTLAFLDAEMAAAGGGYISEVPKADPILRQNPHMHLLEALLALHEVAGNRGYDQRAELLVALFADRMFQRRQGILPELFDDAWKPLPGDAGRHFEPGHHYEWAWLLDQYSRMSGRPLLADTAVLLHTAATLGGSPVGALWSRVRDDGRVLDPSRRLWAHTEAIKAALTHADTRTALETADAWLALLVARFIQPAPVGGWYDHVDSAGQALNQYMPASSLYHIVCAMAEYEERTAVAFTVGSAS